MDELENCCQKGKRGAKSHRLEGGIHGILGSRNHPKNEYELALL